MTEKDRVARNEMMLAQLHPAMARKVKAVIADLGAHGYRVRIQQAWRSPAEQLEAYRSGHSKLKVGFHNICAHGTSGKPEALAVDVVDNDHPLQESRKFILLLASSAEAHGCQTGVRWGLPAKQRKAIDNALEFSEWDAPVKIGWDACHIEPKGMTVSEALNGRRPA